MTCHYFTSLSVSHGRGLILRSGLHLSFAQDIVKRFLPGNDIWPSKMMIKVLVKYLRLFSPSVRASRPVKHTIECKYVERTFLKPRHGPPLYIHHLKFRCTPSDGRLSFQWLFIWSRSVLS